MGTARLNVWVTAVGQPCRIDTEHQWFVHVLHCDGEILRWCDRNYANIPTKCSHAEVEIPPGCYMVAATWSPAPPGQTPTSLGNHISHLAVVRADCEEEVCVTLFPPTFHWCGIWWLTAIRELADLKQVDPEVARAAIGAVEKVLDQVPIDPFTERMQALQPDRRAEFGEFQA